MFECQKYPGLHVLVGCLVQVSQHPGPFKEGFPEVKMNYLVPGQDVRFRIIESDD